MASPAQFPQSAAALRRLAVAGAAQRRTRSGLLIQGSVQPPTPAPGLAEWQRAVCELAQSDWAVTWVPLALDSGLLARAAALQCGKYSTAAHNQCR